MSKVNKKRRVKFRFYEKYQCKFGDILIPIILVGIEFGILYCAGLCDNDIITKIFDGNHKLGEFGIKIEIWSLNNPIWKECSAFMNLLIAFSSITSAIIVFCYSIMDNKRLGIPIRTVIRYFVGNFLIPLVFILILLKLPILEFCRAHQWSLAFDLGVIISFIQQFIVIFIIMKSTSYRMTIKQIAKREWWQYEIQKLYNEEKRYFLSVRQETHIKCAIESEDIFSDKLKLVWEVLCYHMTKYADKGSSKCNLLESSWIYSYYYDNIVYIMSSLKDLEIERHKMFEVLYNFMAKYASNLENDEVIDEEILTLAYSAIIDAMWASDVVEADEFCTYVLNVVIPQENLRKHLITCCFLFMEILYRANKNYDFCKSVNEIESIGDWHFDLRNQGLYFQYWSSAVKKYSFQKNHTNKFFLSAMKTLERKENTSLPMILILQQLRKWKV